MPTKEIGPAKAVYYDIAALKYCVHYIQHNHIDNAIVYILACRIGPFVGKYVKKILKYCTQPVINNVKKPASHVTIL